MRVPIRKPGKYLNKKIDLYLTNEKLLEFKSELDKIKKVIQSKVIKEVKRLAEMGDFSENTEYQIAKGRLRGLNARILELEETIKKVKLIKTGKQSDMIRIGSHVSMEFDGVLKKYLLLGSAESDPIKGIISHTSPIGSALIGKRLGDIFTIQIAKKEVKCNILKIE